MNLKFSLFSMITSLVLSFSVYAYTPQKPATCPSGSAISEFDFDGIRSEIKSGYSLWTFTQKAHQYDTADEWSLWMSLGDTYHADEQSVIMHAKRIISHGPLFGPFYNERTSTWECRRNSESYNLIVSNPASSGAMG